MKKHDAFVRRLLSGREFQRFSQKLFIIMGLGAMALSQAQAGDRLFLKAGVVRPPANASARGALLPRNLPVGGHVVMQFSEPITQQVLGELSEAGIQTLWYLPDDAYLVRLPDNAAERIKWQRLPTLRSVVEFQPQWRMARNLWELPSTAPEKMIFVDVSLVSPEALDSFLAQARDLAGAQILSAQNRGVRLQIPAKQITALSALEGVLWVQEPLPVAPLRLLLDPGAPSAQAAAPYSDLTGLESGTQVMNLPAAWKRGFDGSGQIVSAGDTGLDTGDKKTLFIDFTGLIDGQVFGIFSNSWSDPMGHGTHVAGSIVGKGTGNNGLIKGAAFGASFIQQSLWSEVYGGLTTPSDLHTLFDKAYAAGARVHSNSWGSSSAAGLAGVYDKSAGEVDDFSFNHPDFLILFAAGNDGVDADGDGRIDPGSVSPPATAKNALSVGASQNLVAVGGIQKLVKALRGASTKWPAEPIASSKLSDNINAMAMFSSRGPTSDGRLKPEVVAPGTNILSNCSHQPGAEVLWGRYNNDYCYSGGTSMATPLTAGAAVVTRQYLNRSKSFANPSAALVKNVLMHTAFDMFPGHFGEVGKSKGQELLAHRPDNDQGFGRVDADRATELTNSVLVDDTTGVAVGEAKSITVQVGSPSGQAGSLLATLVYTDFAAAPNSAKALVNDLDLEVSGPQGVIAVPKDRVNNFKFAELKNLAPGSYTVVVRGFNVPKGVGGKQPYSLVVTTDVPQAGVAD